MGERDFGKDEGACATLSVVRGGLVGWQRVHVCWGFEYDRLSNPEWDRVDGRRAIALDADFKLDSPGSSNPELRGGRLWLDAETGLPIQRTYSFFATGGSPPSASALRNVTATGS